MEIQNCLVCSKNYWWNLWKLFENLPEEEQLSIQVAQATVDMIGAKDPSFDQGLLDEYLE